MFCIVVVDAALHTEVLNKNITRSENKRSTNRVAKGALLSLSIPDYTARWQKANTNTTTNALRKGEKRVFHRSINHKNTSSLDWEVGKKVKIWKEKET